MGYTFLLKTVTRTVPSVFKSIKDKEKVSYSTAYVYTLGEVKRID